MLQLSNSDKSFQFAIAPAKAQAQMTLELGQQGLAVKVTAPLGPEAQAEARQWAAAAGGGGAPEPVQSRISRVERRARLAVSYLLPQLRETVDWLIRSREDTNFTYDLTPQNRTYLVHMLSVVLGRSTRDVQAYVDEPENDPLLMGYLRARAAAVAGDVMDRDPHFGRRLGWYAVVRARKPKVVVETGVDKGLGAVLLCAALRKNAEEGHPGQYFGTDINPAAGALLAPPYADVGRILYGDSIESLKTLDRDIDLFINDSDHSDEYEAREYEIVAPRLSPGALVLSDNAHGNASLAAFAEKTGRRFLYFGETPDRHWYPGAGIGFAF